MKYFLVMTVGMILMLAPTNIQNYEANDMKRDPRVNPKAGDEVKQSNHGCHLRVKNVDGDRVEWQRKTRSGWAYDNAWTLKGWQTRVADNAELIHVAT